MTVKELKEKAKELGLTGYSKLLKADLEKLIATEEATIKDITLEQAESIVESVADVVSYNDDTEWKEIRNKGIGGSDIGGILGQSKWNAPIDVYLDKTGQKEDSVDNNYSYYGKLFENPIRKDFASKHPEYSVYTVPFTFISKEYDYFVANVDGLIFDKEKEEWGILEIKTSSEWNLKEWSGETIPQSYFLQVQWYLMITGLKFAKIYAIIGGNKPFELTIVRATEEELGYMRDQAIYFWENHVKALAPPLPDGSESYMDYLKKQTDDLEKESIELDDEIDSKANRIKVLEETLKSIKEEQEKLKQEIFAVMIQENTYKGKTENHKYTIVTTNRTTLDSKALEKAHPELVKKFQKTIQSKYIRIS